jgi:gas vesicle protein
MAKSMSVRDLAIGFAVGAAAASLLPVFFPETNRSKRELLKKGLKQTVRAFEGGVERLAELRENVEDLLAEVSAEIAEEAKEANAVQDVGNGTRAG